MRNLQMTDLSQLLHNNIVCVKFKKVNGEERTLKCTLLEKYIPQSNSSSKTKKTNDNVYSVWSVDDNGWRSFRKDSIISYDVNSNE